MSRRFLILLLVVGAVLRAAAVPLPGTGDVGAWKLVSVVAAHDPAGIYGRGGNPPERRLLRWNDVTGTTEYPPLAVYELAAAGRIYWSIDPLYRDSPTLTALIKASGLLADIVFVVVLLTWGRRVFGVPAEWIALAFWLNPAVILNGAVLGYLDPQMAVPATLALLAAGAGQPLVAGILAACAVATKPQALFVLPAIALLLWRDGRGVRQLAGAAASGISTCVVLVLPVILRGGWSSMLQAMARLGVHDQLSAYNLNIWWIATWLARARTLIDQGWWTALTVNVRILAIVDWARSYPNPKAFASVSVCLAILAACWRHRRLMTAAEAALLGAWCVYTYTMLGVQVHENHLFLAVPFIIVAAGLDRSLRPLAWAVSGIAAMNMYLFYGLGDGHPPWLDRRWTGIDMSVWFAFVNIGIYIWATRAMWRMNPVVELRAEVA